MLAETTGRAVGVPSYGSVLVGRSRDLTRVRAAVEAGPGCVTLVGVSGVGKTRLAVEVARAVAEAGTVAGAVFVDLASARTGDDVTTALVAALAPPASRWLAKTRISADALVRTELAARGRVLVVLDNFEQLEKAAGAVVARLLVAAPEASVLATSRRPLEVPAETLLAIEPLSVPAPEETAPAAIATSDAVRLFVARTPELARAEVAAALPVVADVVRRLDGIPLAIELAVGRLEIMSLDELRDRLAQRFRVLRTPGARTSRRHATIEAAIDWSWRLLDASQRAALGQLAVLESWFTLEDAEALVRLRRGDVADVLHALCRQSLVRAETAPSHGRRFALYQSVRELAYARLSARDRAGVAERHAARFVAVGRSLAGRAETDDVALAALGTIHDDALAAHRWLCARAVRTGRAADVHAAQHALLAMAPILRTRRSPSGWLPLIAQTPRTKPAVARRASADDADTEAAIDVLHAHALRWLGRAEEALPIARRAAALARDPRIRGAALVGVARAHYNRGDTDAAARAGEEALALHVECGDRAAAAEMLSEAALAADAAGRTAEAEARFARGIEHAIAGGAQREEALLRTWRGISRLEQDRMEEARVDLETALAARRRLGDRHGEAIVVGCLGHVVHRGGDLARARDAYATTLSVVAALGDRVNEVSYLANLGGAELELGDLEAAEQSLRAALRAWETDVRDAHGELFARSALAATLALRGERDEALALIRTSERAPRSTTIDERCQAVVALYRVVVDLASEPPTEQRLAAARASLDRLAALEGAPGTFARSAPTLELRLKLPFARAQVAAAERRLRTWEFGADGDWFAPPNATRTSLQGRAAIARLLARLVRAATEESSRGCDAETLVRASWPDAPKLRGDSGRNRLHVALAHLRKAGLATVLQRHDGGWRLDPSVPIRVVSRPA